jgi:hypothetical protein
VIAQDNRRIPGAHSLAGAVIRQAVLDCKAGYRERPGEYSAEWFLYVAGLTLQIDSIYHAIVTSNPDAYYEARKARG